MSEIDVIWIGFTYSYSIHCPTLTLPIFCENREGKFRASLFPPPFSVFENGGGRRGRSFFAESNYLTYLVNEPLSDEFVGTDGIGSVPNSWIYN